MQRVLLSSCVFLCCLVWKSSQQKVSMTIYDKFWVSNTFFGYNLPFWNDLFNFASTPLQAAPGSPCKVSELYFMRLKYLNKQVLLIFVERTNHWEGCAPPAPLLPWWASPPDPPSLTSANVSPVGHDACTMIRVHACTVIIVHACVICSKYSCTFGLLTPFCFFCCLK